MRVALVALLIVPVAATSASAQKWKDIGKTASGNMVSVDPRTIKRAEGKVSANVRVVFTTPVQARNGIWKSTRTSATFDCATKKLAAKENVYYSDEKSTKVVEKTVNRIPGYGPALDGSLGMIALTYLCSQK